MATSIDYKVYNRDGLQVFAVHCYDDATALCELRHYAAQYADEAPLTIKRRHGKRWRTVGSFVADQPRDAREGAEGGA